MLLHSIPGGFLHTCSFKTRFLFLFCLFSFVLFICFFLLFFFWNPVSVLTTTFCGILISWFDRYLVYSRRLTLAVVLKFDFVMCLSFQHFSELSNWIKLNFMKIKFENSIRRLTFLCSLPDTKIVWINSWTLMLIQKFLLKSSAIPNTAFFNDLKNSQNIEFL